jgi:lipopolysaccharide biosynthesis glycosyltransferase
MQKKSNSPLRASHAYPKADCCVFLAGSVLHDWDLVSNGMRITAKSCRATNPEIPIIAIVDDDSPAVRSALEGCELVVIDPIYLKTSFGESIDIGSTYRFLVHYLKGYKKALYIDGHTLILGDLKPLFESQGHLVGRKIKKSLLSDYSDPALIRRKEEVFEPVVTIDAGVILFDMNYWEDGKIVRDSRNITKEYGLETFRDPAQSLINIIYWRRGIQDSLPNIYNTFDWEIDVSRNYQDVLMRDGLLHPRIAGKDVHILNFGERIKPWQLARHGYFPFKKRSYRYYAQFLPWYSYFLQAVIFCFSYVKNRIKHKLLEKANTPELMKFPNY